VQRPAFIPLLLLILVAASGLKAADPDANDGTGNAPPTLPETEVIGRPEGTVSMGENVGPGGPGTNSVFNGTMFQSPPVQGYAADSATTGTLINVPQLDVPATVAVVPEAALIDQQVLRVDDLLQDVPGAVKVTDERRPDAFYLRGFLVTSRDYRKNGFLDPTYTPRDFANVDRVEVLEGPSSVLYGAGQPSGSVNLITKQPLPYCRQEGSVQVGSYGLQRYLIDSSGPVYDDGTLMYRVITDYQKNDSFRDFGYNESAFVAPSLTWEIDRDTTLTWEGEFATDRRRYDTGVAAINGQLNMPISRFLGEPTDFQHFQDYRESLVLNHKINCDWALRIGGYSLFYNAESSATVPVAEVSGSPGSYYRSRQDIGPFREQYQSVIADLAGTVDIGATTHHLVFGTEEGWFTSNVFHATSSYPGLDPLVINGNAPVYGNVPAAITPAEVFDSRFYQDDYGFYVQDLVDVTDHWKVLAGARYDHCDVVFDRALSFFGFPIIPPTRSVEQFDVGTPRVGVIYEPIPQKVSFYGMYAASFAPPNGGPYLETGPLQPEFGQIWEGGVKLKASNRLMLTAAAFHIAKENVSVILPDGFHLEQIGGQQSDGAEFSAVGTLTDRLSVLANYTYTNTELTDPSPGSAINGQRALNVPYNTASAWARYNFVANECRTFGVGLGLVYVGDRLGDYYSSLDLPSYTRCDAGVYYHRNRMDVNVFVENVFDSVYYVSSVNQFEVFPGSPTNVKAQLSWRF
jgi:iron complex outermembrane recepter protein